MDNSVERDKRIEEIQQYIATSGRIDTGTKVFTYIEVDDASFLLTELSRLQVERDKAIEGLRWYADSQHNSEYWSKKARTVLSELGVPHDPLD